MSYRTDVAEPVHFLPAPAPGTLFFGSGSGSSSYKNWLTSSEKRVFLRLNTGSVSDQKVPALTGSGSAALCRAKECYSFIPVLSYGPQSRIGSRFCGSGLFGNVM